MIKELCLSFENCEYMSFPFDSVKSFEVKNVTQSIVKTQKLVEARNMAQYVYMVIDAKENVEKNYIAFGGANPFDRIVNCPDIVSITLKYDDYEQELYVPYAGVETNSHQYSYIKDNGDIVITIDEHDE